METNMEEVSAVIADAVENAWNSVPSATARMPRETHAFRFFGE
jgi:hypothetical protein